MELDDRVVYLKNTPQGCVVVRTIRTRSPVRKGDGDVEEQADIAWIESDSEDTSSGDEFEDFEDDGFEEDGWQQARIYRSVMRRDTSRSYLARTREEFEEELDNGIETENLESLKKAEWIGNMQLPELTDENVETPVLTERDPVNLDELSYGKGLTEEQKSDLKGVLAKHEDCFATSLTDIEQTSLVEHHIRVPPGTSPVYRPGFKRFSQPELEFIQRELDTQLKAGVIRENDGPWCAPVTLALKKSGKYRFCVAYIGLNSVTERESWPLPNIEEIMDNVAGYKWYTTLDGFSGFNTIPIREEDRHLTTF